MTRSPFIAAALCCLALVGWALWTGGVLDTALARQARTGSIAVADGYPLDKQAAERIVGNRKLVVVFAEAGADLSEGCDDMEWAAGDAVVLLLSPEDDGFDSYGCALLLSSDEDFGKQFVTESRISSGIDQFADEPLTALKVIAVNYDLLVKAGTVPDGPRTISPPLPRYAIAAAAVAATLSAAALGYLAALRAGRAAARHREERDHATDARTVLSAETAVLAQRIIAIEGTAFTRTRAGKRAFRGLAADYAALATDIAAADGPPDPELVARVRALSERSRSLTGER
jgi:hypothetical protein